MKIDISKFPGTHLERVATILRFAGWFNLIVQSGLAAASEVLLLLAISGRTFNRAAVTTPGLPGPLSRQSGQAVLAWGLASSGPCAARWSCYSAFIWPFG